MREHDLMLDDAARLSLGVLSAEQEAQVRAHLKACDECAAEYSRFEEVVDLLALGEAVEAERAPSAALKARIMAIARPKASRFPRQHWVPAYLFAGVCLGVAVILGVICAGLLAQVNSQKTVIADLTAPATQRTTSAWARSCGAEPMSI